jgi:hypothetical protein
MSEKKEQVRSRMFYATGAKDTCPGDLQPGDHFDVVSGQDLSHYRMVSSEPDGKGVIVVIAEDLFAGRVHVTMRLSVLAHVRRITWTEVDEVRDSAIPLTRSNNRDIQEELIGLIRQAGESGASRKDVRRSYVNSKTKRPSEQVIDKALSEMLAAGVVEKIGRGVVGDPYRYRVITEGNR